MFQKFAFGSYQSIHVPQQMIKNFPVTGIQVIDNEVNIYRESCPFGTHPDFAANDDFPGCPKTIPLIPG